MNKLAVALATTVALSLSAVPAWASEDGNTFNNEWSPYNVDLSDCIRTNGWDGIAAFAYNNTYLPFGLSARNDYCPPSSAGEPRMRILKLERLTVTGRTTYVNRGQANQPHTHVSASDLKDGVAVHSTSVRNGNGRAALSCPWTMYAHPDAAWDMPGDMYYKAPWEVDAGENVDGAQWANYGNPGTRYGSSYTYLLWNLPRHSGGVRRGGGIIRAILKQNHQVQLCDVSQLQLPSFDRYGNQNGYVQFAYARTNNGYQTISGWFLVRFEKWGWGLRDTYHW